MRFDVHPTAMKQKQGAKKNPQKKQKKKKK